MYLHYNTILYILIDLNYYYTNIIYLLLDLLFHFCWHFSRMMMTICCSGPWRAFFPHIDCECVSFPISLSSAPYLRPVCIKCHENNN